MSVATTNAFGSVYGDLPHVTGRFYDSRLNTATTTLILVANTLYGVPFYVPTATTYTSMALEVTTLAAGKSVRLGIYNDSTGTPGTLVLDAGTISTTTTGAKTIAISQLLAAGWYWLAGVSDSSVAVLRASTTGGGSLGFTAGTDTTPHLGVSVAFTYGALPSPFQAGYAVTNTSAHRFMLGV